MKNTSSYLILPFLMWIGMLCTSFGKAENEDVLNRIIYLPAKEATVYQLLELVTKEAGLFFIYDSRIVNNEQIVFLPAGEYSIREAVLTITGNMNFNLQVIGDHILIQLPAEIKDEPVFLSEPEPEEKSETWFTIEGIILDSYTKSPIQFGTVGVFATSIGTITNQNGEFRIHIPDSLINSAIVVSHVGYERKEIKNVEILNTHTTFLLEPKVISLQEVVVRLSNPQRLINEMLEKRKDNYSLQPVYFTSFYREGVERKKGIVNMTEAVFKVYKTPYDVPTADQVKLLKMRKISNEQEKDTLIAKMKSGIQSSLLLDLVKNLPDFFMLNDPMNPYNYIHSDITVIDNQIANVISFEQKKGNKDPLFKGQLYLDNENDALLMVSFEINPLYVDKATNLFIEKKSKNLKINTSHISYSVSYKRWGDRYYINHIRGDLHFKVRKKRQLFNTNIHTWFEMATCKIETEDINRFSRNEILSKTSIFSDTHFVYDADFWGNFNTILPEEKLNESLSKITAKIEEIDY